MNPVGIRGTLEKPEFCLEELLHLIDPQMPLVYIKHWIGLEDAITLVRNKCNDEMANAILEVLHEWYLQHFDVGNEKKEAITDSGGAA